MNEEARQRDKIRRDQAVRDNTLRALCAHKDGRDFLWWLLEQGNTFGVAFATDSAGRHDTGLSAFLAGKQSYGRLVLDEILRAAPEAYLSMTKENRMVKNDNRNNSGNSDDSGGNAPGGDES